LLGTLRSGSLARQARLKVAALGGMDANRARRMRGLGIYGWAAIDAWEAKPD
jgi:thiamine-phosphate pyrophosphorylase